MTQTERGVTIDCGGNELIGVLHQPEFPKSLAIVILVGGPQYRVGAHRQFLQWAREFAEAGHSVLRFDYAGTGDSAGCFLGFEQVNEDIAAAIAWLTQTQPTIREVCLVGLCDGASAALIHGVSHHVVRRLILINPWVWSEASESQTFVKHYYRQRLLSREFWKNLLTGKVRIAEQIRDFWRRVTGGGNAPSDDQAGRTRYQNVMARGLLNFTGTSLILLAEHDLVARDFEDHVKSDPLWHQAVTGKGVSLVHIEDSDHTFSRPTSQRRLLEGMLGWLKHEKSA